MLARTITAPPSFSATLKDDSPGLIEMAPLP